MANTHGREIVLGIEEQPSGKLSVNGIQDIAKVRRTSFDGQSNRRIISRDLLTDESVKEVTLRGVKVLSIEPNSRPPRPTTPGMTSKRWSSSDALEDGAVTALPAMKA